MFIPIAEKDKEEYSDLNLPIWDEDFEEDDDIGVV
jgi:hypothetical protein